MRTSHSSPVHAFERDIAALPRDVDLVWHGVNDAANLRQFLAAGVPWGELDLNLDPAGRRLILRHDSYAELPQWVGEQPLSLADALPALVDAGKSIKLDFKIGGTWIDTALALVDELHLPQDRLWLNADLDVFGEQGVRRLADRYPDAILQVPLHSLPGWMDGMQAVFDDVEEIAAWGINRFSVGWRYPDVPGMVAQLKERGHEANIYGVADRQEFLQAIDLRPKSVTADFNFPEWYYYGRGSGHGGRFYTYTISGLGSN